jgi:hypothetical protein
VNEPNPPFNPTSRPRGPYNHAAEAIKAAEPVYRLILESPDPLAMRRGNFQVLIIACRSASVALGVYDRQVLEELANQAPETVEVIAAIVSRARCG